METKLRRHLYQRQVYNSMGILFESGLLTWSVWLSGDKYIGNSVCIFRMLPKNTYVCSRWRGGGRKLAYFTRRGVFEPSPFSIIYIAYAFGYCRVGVGWYEVSLRTVIRKSGYLMEMNVKDLRDRKNTAREAQIESRGDARKSPNRVLKSHRSGSGPPARHRRLQ